VRILIPLALATLALCGCASQSQKHPSVSPAKAGIPLSEFGNIYDWRPDGAAGIYIETDDRRWFHATFMTPCENLPFTEHVGVRTTPPLPITQFDSIEVRGENCFFQTLERVSGPPAAKQAKS
jgi:hypothetical protein